MNGYVTNPVLQPQKLYMCIPETQTCQPVHCPINPHCTIDNMNYNSYSNVDDCVKNTPCRHPGQSFMVDNNFERTTLEAAWPSNKNVASVYAPIKL